MPAIRLLPQIDTTIVVSDGTNPSIEFPQWRLRAWVRLAQEIPIRQAVLDSGSSVAVMSKEVWRPFHERGRIEWLAHAPGIQDDLDRMGKVLIHGGRYSYRLGRLEVQLAELSGTNTLPTVSVLTQFLEDSDVSESNNRPLQRLLILGLSGGVFARRELRVQFDGVGNPASATVSEPA